LPARECLDHQIPDIRPNFPIAMTARDYTVFLRRLNSDDAITCHAFESSIRTSRVVLVSQGLDVLARAEVDVAPDLAS
jgi:hypothetical protein